MVGQTKLVCLHILPEYMKKHILKRIYQHKSNLITNLQYLLCQTENRCLLHSLVPQNQINLQNQKKQGHCILSFRKKQLLENLFAFNISVVISSVFSSYKNGGPKIIHSSERSHTFPICIRATLFSNETLRQGASYETRIEKNWGILLGPNTGFEFGRRYECIKSMEYHKRQKILLTDTFFPFCFMLSLDKLLCFKKVNFIFKSNVLRVSTKFRIRMSFLITIFIFNCFWQYRS